jgi:Dyp-type peroxidase family
MPDDHAFQLGMKKRGVPLHDPPVEHWERGYQGVIHALLIVADNDSSTLAREAVRLREAALAAGASILVEEPGYRLQRDGQDIEHFGYVDGISQPKWETPVGETVPGGGSLCDPNIVLAQEPGPTKSLGSFMVFRKLEQNVALWEENILRLAAEMNADPDVVSALVIGRFKDGTPVTVSDRMQPDQLRKNDFNYTTDFEGGRCPLHAHIRKTNPRGEGSPRISGEKHPQIVRRGMSYGVRPDLHPSGSSFPLPRTGVGLLFMCYQKSIADFEYMQEAANGCDLPRHDAGPDPLIGQAEARSVNQWPTGYDSTERISFAFESAVTLKGGEYFFAPSLMFLNNLRR